MTYTVSITSQGQISIPAAIRRELGLNKKKQATVTIEAGKMVVEPIIDFLKLKGSLKTNKKTLSPEKMRALFETYIAEDVMKSMQ